MIDLEGFPVPEGAPEAGACVRVERPEEGLVVLVLDPPHRSLAVLDGPLLRDLDRRINALEDEAGLRGLVIAGRAPDQFAAGADVHAIRAIEDPELVEKVVLEVHKLFRRLAGLRARTVAAVGGPVPGGAYELSLACDFIVASDSKKTRIGLPETQLGILPGWGGTHRLPRRIGVPLALDAILNGRLLPAKAALRRGMIDRITPPEYLARVAAGIALGRETPRKKDRRLATWAMDRNPLVRPIIARAARKKVLAKTGGHYPAPLEALDMVVRAPGVPLEEAARKEAAAVARLATGPVSKNLIDIFLASEEAKKLGRGQNGFVPRRFENAFVIGGGVMGAGIASLMAEKGLRVRLADLSRAALDQAELRHRADLEKKLKRRRIKRHEFDAALDRLDASTEMAGFQHAQVVVEAVAEKLAIKRQVFETIAAGAPPDTILATNTSSLSVDAIAEGLPHPERVCGFHFFNPVKRMPLVEVVRGVRTSEATVAEMAALALRLGKTPVVVRDVAGFLVNRLLGPYLDEAVRLFAGGADIAHVDAVMKDFGMPMGPFTLLDEVGLDIAAHAAKSLHEAYGERMTPSEGIEALMSPERLGKKTGRGFYEHPPRKGRKTPKPVPAGDLARFQKGSSAATLSDEAVTDRLVLAMVNEAARCLEEGVVAGPVELDLATVFGTGFAPFRGGLLKYADTLGPETLVRRLDAIATAADVAARPGGREKFTPCERLREMAREGRGFHAAPPRP